MNASDEQQPSTGSVDRHSGSIKTKAHKIHLQKSFLENLETEANKDKNSANTPLNWNEEKQRKSCLTLFWLADAIAEAFCLMAGRTTCFDGHTKELRDLCLAPLSPSLGARVLAVVVALTGMAATFCDLAIGLLVNLPLGCNWGTVLLRVVDVIAEAAVLWEELENCSWPIGRFDRVLPAMPVGILPNLPRSASFMFRTIASYCDLGITIVLVGFLTTAALATVGLAAPGFGAEMAAVSADWTALASDVDFNSRFASESNFALIWSSDRPKKQKTKFYFYTYF